LTGVSEANPISPNNPWFAIPTTQNGFSQIVAILVAAKLASATVDVATTGALAASSCGSFAGVDHVSLT